MARKSSYRLPPEKWLFISNDNLRAILRRDYAELRRLTKIKAHKSIVVLAGSILEAALLDTLGRDPENAKKTWRALEVKARPDPADQRKPEPVSRWGLEESINVATELGYFKSDTKQLADILRQYRNLIHPGVEHRKAFEVDQHLVDVVLPLFNKVLRALAKAGPSQSSAGEDGFLRLLRQSGINGADSLAEDLMEWAEHNGLIHNWTSSLTYLPELLVDGRKITPIAIEANGRLRVRFGHLKQTKTPMRIRQERDKIRHLLNGIAGVMIPPSQVDAFPAISLAILDATEDTYPQFVGVLDNLLSVIKTVKG